MLTDNLNYNMEPYILYKNIGSLSKTEQFRRKILVVSVVITDVQSIAHFYSISVDGSFRFLILDI